MKDDTDRDFLLQAAMWQDTLLQAYRYLHITFQSILLAIGIGLVALPMSSSIFPRLTTQAVVATFLLLCVWIIQMLTTWAMVNIVNARGHDVDYWHMAVILEEQKLPPEQRHFTEFKIHQQARRKDVTYLRELFLNHAPITPEQAKELIEKGTGHTRRVVDRLLFVAISLLWGVLVITSVGILIHDILW